MGKPRLILIVTLDVRHGDTTDFDRYETQAAAIMARWEGKIERVVRLQGEHRSGEFREVHIVSFPDEAALGAYRQDPDLTALSSLRERVIVSTAILRGYDLPVYGASPAA